LRCPERCWLKARQNDAQIVCQGVDRPANIRRSALIDYRARSHLIVACKSPGPAAFWLGVLGVVAGTGRLVVVVRGEEVQGRVFWGPFSSLAW
jgi:hypothetical protein